MFCVHSKWLNRRVAALFLLLCAALILSGWTLSNDELKLLQDRGGWQYITVSDSDNGIQTQHVCFDGHPHPQECSGRLTFSPANTFVQDVHIHGQTVERHGTYELDDNQVSLFDELGTKDGPYIMHINSQAKTLVLEMPQVRIELELESQYREDLRKQRKPQ